MGDVANGTVSATYVRGIGLIASNNLTFSASRIYYHYNGHGDVVQITSINGTVITSYDYDTFGNEKLAQQTWDNNPFRYCGEYFDSSSGTYYLRNRYYNPRTSRMLTEDPIRDGLNWYTYANNNPIKYIDPSGLVAVNIVDYVKAIIKIAVNGLTQGYIINNDKIDNFVLNTNFGCGISSVPVAPFSVNLTSISNNLFFAKDKPQCQNVLPHFCSCGI